MHDDSEGRWNRSVSVPGMLQKLTKRELAHPARNTPVEHLPVLASPFILELLYIQAADCIPVGLVHAVNAIPGRLPPTLASVP